MNMLAVDAFGGRRMDFNFEVKADDVKPDGWFKGYASVFKTVDQGGDAVQPGAFAEGLTQAKADERLIPMLWQHDRTEPLGTWPVIREDRKGLYVEGQMVLEENPLARRALALMKSGALGGMSIGYRIPAGGAEEDTKRRGVYLLKKLTLIEVSVVTMPMLLQARVQSVKSMIEGGMLPSVADLVAVLREVGMDADVAKSIGEASRPILEKAAEPDPEKGSTGDADAFYKALAARMGA